LYKGAGRSAQAVGLKKSAVKQRFFLGVESINRGGIGEIATEEALQPTKLPKTNIIHNIPNPGTIFVSG
jgi:hypothetical protein